MPDVPADSRRTTVAVVGVGGIGGVVAALRAYSADASTSMYFDRMSGRPLEGEALTGAIVACGDRHGVATPLNTAVLTLLRAANAALDAQVRE